MDLDLLQTKVIGISRMGNADTHGATDVAMMLAGGGSNLRRGVTTSGGNNYTQHDMLHTAAQACGVTLDYGRIIPQVLA